MGCKGKYIIRTCFHDGSSLHIFCRLVIETLKDVDDERRCFRLVGGVLVERTVKDVLPALVNNKDQVSNVIFLIQTTLN